MRAVIRLRNERWRAIVAALVFAPMSLATIACSEDDKKPTDPDPEPVPIITESFDGEIAQGTRSCHEFDMGFDGGVELEITALEPLETLTVGLALGQPDTASPEDCADFVEDNNVRIFQTLASSGLLAGPYCACVQDVGNIFPGEEVTYTLEVRHP